MRRDVVLGGAVSTVGGAALQLRHRRHLRVDRDVVRRWGCVAMGIAGVPLVRRLLTRP